MRLKGFNTESACSFEYKYQVGSSGNRSRPCFVIMDQLEFLQSKHFLWASIAKLLGISEQSLRRRVEFRLERDCFTVEPQFSKPLFNEVLNLANLYLTKFLI